MDIATDILKTLREKTGVSVMQCKKALEEAGGDLAKAEVILRKRSSEAAEKKADRALGAGVIGNYIHEGSIGALVVLSCETDFVAKNPEFMDLARSLAMQVTATDPKFLSSEAISEEVKNAAISVFEKEVEGKPEDMKAKILDGKIASYFRDQVLLEQGFIKDADKSIKSLLNEATQKFGERVELTSFTRLSVR